MKIVKLVIDPDNFFSELNEEKVSIRRPASIVMALAVVISIQQFLIMMKIAEASPTEVFRFLMIGAYMGIVSTIIGSFAAWFVLSVIMHLVSYFQGGSGYFRRMFEFTGYGYLPSLVGILFTAPLSGYYIMQARIPHININQFQTPGFVKSVILLLIPSDLIYANLMINVAVTFWSITIWIFAVKHAHGLTIKQSFISTVIPTILFTAWQINSIVRLIF